LTILQALAHYSVMKYLRFVASAAAIVGLYFSFGVTSASAAVTTAPPPIITPETLPVSPMLITAYHINDSALQFVQLYNNSSELVSLDGGSLVYAYSTDPAGTQRIAVVSSGFIEPRTHVIVAVEGLLPQEALPYHFASTTVLVPATIASLQLLMPGAAPSTVPVTLKTNGTIQQRGKTSTGYSTVTFGDFSGDLYADSLYVPPTSPPLKIVEIAPRAKTCEPFSLEPTCGDYVKLKLLPGYSDGIRGELRLRSDAGNESVTNTFSLAYASRHDEYLLVRLRDDGQLLSLTNSGGYVWLEDSYGAMRYDETLTSYADAGSETYVDKSWALDETDGTWKWATPSPTGPNVFPQVLAAGMGSGLDTSECPAGKYRNPETNRCRSIEEAVSALTVCEEGKERNPVTNRCRSVATTTSASLTPCGEGEERNPSTNRCRKVASSSGSLTPCQLGYERNPETNRCRKATGVGALSSPAAVAMESSGGSVLKNALIVTAGLGALGYGFYEWRSEIGRAARRVVTLVTGK
jgi:hypothetical protein